MLSLKMWILAVHPSGYLSSGLHFYNFCGIDGAMFAAQSINISYEKIITRPRFYHAFIFDECATTRL